MGLMMDHLIREGAGPEPEFDAVTRDFLANVADELRQRLRPGGILEAVDLGTTVPWLWRLTFSTRGLGRDARGAVVPVDRHTVAVRFFPDYLRHANRYLMLTLIEPDRPFHPNLRDRHLCLEVYPGEPLVELCESLHALFSWRLRQLSEADALDAEACAWGRAHLDELPLDPRPLFGRQLPLVLDRVEAP
jgi:hypothetical protein